MDVAVLLPKDDVAWVIGKRGIKISKLRERTRVAINDAESPPFASHHSVIMINGAPLAELLNVLQLVIDDLALRQDDGNKTQLLIPAEHSGAVIGQGGEVIRCIIEQSGAE